jgi:selenocysteine-specific elongation factor
LHERGEVLRVARPAAYVHAGAANALLERVTAFLRAAQAAEPWAMGATSLMISRSLAIDEPFLVRVLEAIADEGRIARRAGYFSTVDYVPRLSEDQQRFFDSHVPLDPSNPFAPSSLADVVGAVKQSRVPGIAKAFDTLLAKGALVKVNDDLYRGTQIAQIHARIEQFLRANERMTMAQFRDVIGTSRKYAVPLLEWFDARGITVRSGDYRMLRAKRG